MSRYVALLSATLAMAFAIAACGPGANEVANAPANTAKPPSWDDQSETNWLYRSQFKSNMRHMWIDANRIVSAGRGDKRPTYDEIWAGAEDILRRARGGLNFWSTIVKQTEMLQMAMDDDDRPGATEEFRALGMACDGCHMATWSPAYLHVTLHNLEAWQNNRIKLGMEMEKDDNPPPEIPHRVLMQKMWKQYQAAQLALQDWKKPQVTAETRQIAEAAKSQVAMLKMVVDGAEKLLELAKAQKSAGLADAYNTMIGGCQSCHAANAGAPRPILNPMPWEGPVD